MLGLVVAHSVPVMSDHVPKPLALTLVAADVVIMLSLRPEHLFLVWLFLAPLLQESAEVSRMGHLLALALYIAPPLIVAAKQFLGEGSRPRREWFDYVPALYAGFVFVSLVVTSGGTLRGSPMGTMHDFYATIAMGVVVYYVTAFWRGTRLSVVRVCWVVLAGAIVESVMAVFEWKSGWNLWHDDRWHVLGDTRAVATLGNPALTGAFIGVGFVIALSVLAWNGPAQLRRLSVAMLIVALPGLYATKTRGPLLATVIAGTACVLLSSRARIVGLGAVALAALTLIVFWPQIKASSTYENRFSSTQNVDIRLVLQKVSFRLAEERPFLGWGYNAFDRVKLTVPIYSDSVPVAQALFYTSHNSFLTILVDYGGIGLTLFLLPFVPVMWRAFRRARVESPNRWFYVAGLASIVVVAVTGATLDYRFFSFVPMLPWLFLGLLRRETTSSTVSR
jgi:O-antigen ligase